MRRDCACARSWDLHASDGIARAIAVEDADIVLIQHQPGLLSWGEMTRLLTDRRLAGRKTVVTLHAAERLLDRAGR